MALLSFFGVTLFYASLAGFGDFDYMGGKSSSHGRRQHVVSSRTGIRHLSKLSITVA